MIKKIILLIAILGPFGLYFFYSWLLKLEKKKIPIAKLSVASLILLMLALGFLRFTGGFDPNTKRVFYYNLKTQKSFWKKPSTLPDDDDLKLKI